MNWNDLTLSEKSELMSTYIKNGVTSLDQMRSHFNSFAAGGPKDPPKKKEPTPFEKALYNSVNPTEDYPGFSGAVADYIYAKQKAKKGEEDILEYEIGNTLGEQVAQAAWAKRLNMPYDESLLPIYNGDTLRLPHELEMEIPTDTNFIKERIESNKTLQERFPKYKNNEYVNAAIKEDENTLEALRKTYSTGKPVGLSEMSWNSRQLLNNGEINNTQVSPLNVLHNYNIRYDQPTNRMYYSDEYDFNQYENFVPGDPFRFRGFIDLNKK